MTTTQITDISALLDLTAVYGDHADDFDTDAVQDEYVAALQDAAAEFAPSITVHANGMVFADVAETDAAREIDWDELADGIDLSAIMGRHDITG
jgi:hypothetical protein